MSTDILGSLLRVLVTVPENRLGLIKDLAHKFTGRDGDQWEQETKVLLRKKMEKQTESPRLKTSILEFISTVVVPATTVPFVAKKKFVVNTAENAPVKISHIEDKFRGWFLSGDGKTEDPIGEQTLRCAKLRNASVNGPIIAELGGEEKSETTLSEMFSLLQIQGKGEDGVLLNNGYANIFYIKDAAGILRAVDVRWGLGDGWFVYANSVLRKDGWIDRNQVFSRNSVVLESSETLVSA